MNHHRLRALLAFGCFLVCAGIACSTYTHTLDSNTYLDMGRFVSQRNWQAALSPFWGLTYGWLLGVLFSILGSSPWRELLAIRILNSFCCLCAILAFDVLLSGILATIRRRAEQAGQPVLHPRGLCVAAYGILLWSMTVMTWPSIISPDLLVAAIFFLSTGLLLHIALGRRPILRSAALALALALGYYTKAIYVPLGLTLLACLVYALFRVGKLRSALPVALTLLLLACAPYYIAVGRQTKGIPHAASLNYAWLVNGLWRFTHWQGEGRDSGKPIHPTQEITHSLRAFAFGEPIHATYAPWYDPSYWYAGFHTGFSPRNQVKAIVFDVYLIAKDRATKPLLLLATAAFFMLLVLERRKTGDPGVSPTLRAIATLWPIILPCCVGLAIFLAIYVEQRYIQPMVCGLTVALLLPSLAVAHHAHERLRRGALFVLIATICVSLGLRVKSLIHHADLANPLAHDAQWIAAQRLSQSGIPPHTPVAVIGRGADCLWAFLAQVRIVAELPSDYLDVPQGDAAKFAHASPAVQQEVLEAFHRAGAKLAIADESAHLSGLPGWTPLPGTGFSYRFLENVQPNPLPRSDLRANN